MLDFNKENIPRSVKVPCLLIACDRILLILLFCVLFIPHELVFLYLEMLTV